MSLKAIGKAFPMVEFELDGTIISANENFCSSFGYTDEQLKGKHHRTLIDIKAVSTSDYNDFWQGLSNGRCFASKYKYFVRHDNEMLDQATYFPVHDAKGQIYKIVRISFDTAKSITLAKRTGYLTDAMNRAIATMEFDLDGKVLSANKNYLDALGYSLAEIQGMSHSTFVDGRYAESESYRALWAELNHGIAEAKESHRIGKDGKRIWVYSAYQPVLNEAGRVVKILEFAFDINQSRAIVSDVSRALTSLSAGNSSVRVPVDESSEYLDLALTMNDFSRQLAMRVKSVSETAYNVKQYAQTIALGNSSFNTHTEQQAENIEQTAASMNEISRTVDQAVDKIRYANDLVQETQSQAVAGGKVVSETICAMEQIKDSSDRIVEIIKVIDEIAFQTNLLALNASVEAARAGEFGLGFATVADEVRQLSRRSAVAAKEIKALISDTNEKVEFGVTLASRSGDTLSRIVDSFSDVSEVVGQISVATEEQSRGVSEAHSKIKELKVLTQQNHEAMTHAAVAISEELKEQACFLDRAISGFNLSETVTQAKVSLNMDESLASNEMRTTATPSLRKLKLVTNEK